MKAANLCRNENFLSSEPMLQGTTCEGLIKSSPSANLQQLVSYILQRKSQNNSRDVISQTICQLLKLNSVERLKKEQTGHLRHSANSKEDVKNINNNI